MKKLLFLFVALISISSCSSFTEEVNEPSLAGDETSFTFLISEEEEWLNPVPQEELQTYSVFFANTSTERIKVTSCLPSGNCATDSPRNPICGIHYHDNRGFHHLRIFACKASGGSI